MQTWQVLLTVFTFGGLGSIIRALIIHILTDSEKLFPVAILVVNTLAAFLGGLLLYLSLPDTIATALTVGLIGGIGTLSSINGNLLDFIFDNKWRRLVLYFVLTCFCGVTAAKAGLSTSAMIHESFMNYKQEQQALRLQDLGISPITYAAHHIVFSAEKEA